jgi:membrane-associated phospholipid phosphatase
VTEPRVSPPARTPLRPLLTTAAVGLAVFAVSFAALLLSGRLAPLDREAIAAGDDAAAATPRALVQSVTDLGALPVVAALVVLAAFVLVARGHPRAALALALGFVAIVVSVRLIKAGVGRPRPEGHDAMLTNASFPSAHAAYSTAWTAVALALTRVGSAARRMSARVRRGAVAAALLVTLAVGATRVVLDAHYLSDVVGGWGLGAALFALAGALALAVGPMRNTRAADHGSAAREHTETTA